MFWKCLIIRINRLNIFFSLNLFVFDVTQELCCKGAETIQSKSQFAEQAVNELCSMLLTVDSENATVLHHEDVQSPREDEEEEPKEQQPRGGCISISIYLSFLKK